MTRVLAIRHAHTDVAGWRMTGRAAGVLLDEQGEAQAEALPARLSGIAIEAVWASPLERCQQTAAPLARARGLPVVSHDDLTDVHYGEWEGRSLDELAGEPAWGDYNLRRSLRRAPGGESLLEVQRRMVLVLERALAEHPRGCVVLVGHADPLRALLAHLLGVALDLAGRLEISPASVTAIDVDDGAPRVLALNDTGDLPALLA